MSEHELDFRGTDSTTEVPGDRMRRKQADFEQAYTSAVRSGAHLWTALVQHRVVDPQAFVKQAILDSESVVGVQLGCYICEEPYAERLLMRRCKGEPKR